MEIICSKVGMTFGPAGDIHRIEWHERLFDSKGEEITADWGDHYLRISLTRVTNGRFLRDVLIHEVAHGLHAKTHPRDQAHHGKGWREAWRKIVASFPGIKVQEKLIPDKKTKKQTPFN